MLGLPVLSGLTHEPPARQCWQRLLRTHPARALPGPLPAVRGAAGRLAVAAGV